MVEKYEASAFYHPKDFERMKEEETVNFPNVCDYWADNKLSIDLREKKQNLSFSSLQTDIWKIIRK